MIIAPDMCLNIGMASTQNFVDFILEQVTPAGDVRARKMFGEYGLYCDEKVVAFICDDKLFMKPTEISSKFLGQETLAPPYPGAKNYYCVPEEKLEDAEWLADFIRKTTYVFPLQKNKK
jgi:DNA transformation protein